MNIRRFKQLYATGRRYAEIGRECSCDWRTVRKYLAETSAAIAPSLTSAIITTNDESYHVYGARRIWEGMGRTGPSPPAAPSNASCGSGGITYIRTCSTWVSSGFTIDVYSRMVAS